MQNEIFISIDRVDELGQRLAARFRKRKIPVQVSQMKMHIEYSRLILRLKGLVLAQDRR
jgi:hypothetical protein